MFGLEGFEVALALFIIGIPFILWIWALVDILKSRFETETTKIIWILVVLLLPFLGMVLYFFIGTNQKSRI